MLWGGQLDPRTKIQLNICYIWDILQRRVSRRPNLPQTVQTLTEALREEWVAIDQGSIRRLIRSMPRRCRQCVQSRGGHISYLDNTQPIGCTLGFRDARGFPDVLCLCGS